MRSWKLLKYLKLIAEKLEISVSKQDRKQVIKDQLLSVLVERGVLSADEGARVIKSEAGGADQVKLKELEVELWRLDLREKEMQCILEVKRLEEETKRVLHSKELGLSVVGSPVPQKSSQQLVGIDVRGNIRLVPVFREKDVDTYFILFSGLPQH